MTVTRAQYLCELAMTAHMPPPVVDGLAVIFGMMRVINLAQGEFLMLGAYVGTYAAKQGLPLWLAILVAGLDARRAAIERQAG